MAEETSFIELEINTASNSWQTYEVKSFGFTHGGTLHIVFLNNSQMFFSPNEWKSVKKKPQN